MPGALFAPLFAHRLHVEWDLAGRARSFLDGERLVIMRTGFSCISARC